MCVKADDQKVQWLDKVKIQMLKHQRGSCYGSFSFQERSKAYHSPATELWSQVHPYTFRPYFEKNYKAMEDLQSVAINDGWYQVPSK